MDINLFEEIIRKIVKETPDVDMIALYNWSEPFLHPELTKFIQIVKKYDLYCMLSTNFNKADNLNKIVQANPDEIRISLSGYYQSTYSMTHKKGNIENVMANMQKLREIIDKSGLKTCVTVMYLVYLHNWGIDLQKMQELCNKLNFYVLLSYAYMMPFEKLANYFELPELLTENDLELIELLVFYPDELKKVLMKYPLDDCHLRSNRTAINANGSVSLCCAVYSPENIIAKNFLDLKHSELQQLKYEHPTCEICMKHQINKIYLQVGAEELSSIAEKNFRSAKALIFDSLPKY